MEILLFFSGLLLGISGAAFWVARLVLGNIVLINDSLIVELKNEKALEDIKMKRKYVVFGVRTQK